MAVAEVKRLELYAHRSVAEEVLARLQDWGEVEFSSDQTEGSLDEQLNATSVYEARLNDLNYALRFIKPWFEDPQGGLARMLGDRPEATLDQLADLAAGCDVEADVGLLRNFERKLTELKNAQTALTSAVDALWGLSDLPVPFDMISEGTDQVAAFLATGTPEALTDWSVELNKVLDGDGEVKLGLPVGKSRQTPWGLVLYLRPRGQDVAEVTSRLGLSRYELPEGLKGAPQEERARLEAQLEANEAQRKELEASIREFANEKGATFQKLHDYYQALEDRRQALSSGERTEVVVALKGWVRAKVVPELKALLAPYEGSIELVVRDADEGEVPPIALENPGFAQPFETLTMMYGAPKYGSPDPSLPMLPFFLLFFGLCYADAGYGIIVTALTGYVLLKYKKMAQSTRRFIKLIFYSGIATTLVGAAVGGWFGNTVETFGFLKWAQPFVEKLQLINPMNDPMTMLGFSLALGVVHLFYGLLIALWHNLRQGDYLAAFGDQGGWLAFLTGLMVFAGGKVLPHGLMATVGLWLTIAGVVMLVLTQGREKPTLVGKVISGVMSLYNVTGYLGDLLSYSRLLALGLVGGVVAMIVNLMSSMMAGTPYVGWLIALVIFLFGHLFSMVINILGAFVHPLRLQYVEFFGKFYESGGREMKPLRHRPDYVNLRPATESGK